MRALVVDHDQQKIAYHLAGAEAGGHFFNDAALFCLGHGGAREDIAQFGGSCVSSAEIAKLLDDWPCGSLPERNIRERVCVLKARGLQFGLPSNLFTKPRMSASWVCGVSCLLSNDSAPSTASLAASAFSSSRAARSAASISAFAAMATFSASDFASARMRSASAAPSRSASSRSPRISCSRRSSRCSASSSWRSASAFAAVAFVIAEAIFSALALNTGGNFLPKTQISTPATIAKLIHLKSSVGPAADPAPPSSAACAVPAKTDNTLHTKNDE